MPTYSLFVTHLAEEPSRRDLEIGRDRFLEYTSDAIREQLETLSVDAMAFITSHPCVVMQEGRSKELAKVVRISEIASGGGEVRFHIEPLECDKRLRNAALWQLREILDIEQFEFHRNHFAIKERDVIGSLASAGFSFNPEQVSKFEALPLPAPTRSELISAKKSLAEWAHSDLDDLALEIGIREIGAGRDIGGRRERADALVRYSLDKPGAVTAENRLLSAFLVSKASGNSEAYADDARVAEDVSIAFSKRQADPQRSPNRVFVVHGQNEAARSSIVDFLSSVGLQGLVLHEQPNMGRHLLTKFIEEADLVTFAVIVMTDDDVGALKGKELAPRARQNVILELGYFLAHLGQSRVCALITPGLETPSDFDGIVYIKMADDGKWKRELMRELIAADMPVFTDSAGAI